MTPDGFLAAIGLLLAAYQIMPRARRLDLKLRFGVTAWCATIIGVLGILYLQFFSTFAKLGLTPAFGLARYHVTPERASFLLVLLTIAFLWTHLASRRLSVHMVGRFQDLVEELLSTRSYPHLVSLLDSHLHRLVLIADGRDWTLRLRHRFMRTQNGLSADDFGRLLDVLDEAGESLPAIPKPTFMDRVRGMGVSILGRLVAHLPDRTKARDAAEGILSDLLNRRDFAAGVIASRVYFGLNLISLHDHAKHEFFDNYMRELFADTSSVFYTELRSTQNESSKGYLLATENRLLYYLFSDARRAEELGAWRPIGEAMLAELDTLFRDPKTDPYNLPVGADFRERGRWQLPLCVGLHYFDVMVTAALYQGVTWHMWLYYFPYFVEYIARNYAPVENLVDLDDEWPGLYAFLIYEIVAKLRDWVLALRAIPRDQANIVLQRISVEHENDNIPKSSILALGNCLRIALEAPSFPDSFKRYLAEIAYSLYFRVRTECRRDDYARVLLMAIRAGGPAFSGRPASVYRTQLAEAWARFDKIPHRREHLEDLEQGLFA